MNQLEKLVLKTALKQTESLRKRLREASWLDPWLREEKQWGPAYNTKAWFGNVTPARARAILRAIHRLHDDGLFTGCRQWGCRLSHIKLTGAGKKAAKELVVRK